MKGVTHGTNVTTQPNVIPKSIKAGLVEWDKRKNGVISGGVSTLPGCSINVGKLFPLLHKAVAKKFVKPAAALQVEQMFTHGSDLYCDYEALNSSLRTSRMFRNYKSAVDN